MGMADWGPAPWCPPPAPTHPPRFWAGGGGHAWRGREPQPGCMEGGPFSLLTRTMCRGGVFKSILLLDLTFSFATSSPKCERSSWSRFRAWEAPGCAGAGGAACTDRIPHPGAQLRGPPGTRDRIRHTRTSPHSYLSLTCSKHERKNRAPEGETRGMLKRTKTKFLETKRKKSYDV